MALLSVSLLRLKDNTSLVIFHKGPGTSVTNFDFNFEPTVGEPHRIAEHGIARLGWAWLGLARATQRGCHIEMPIKLPGTSMIRGPKHFLPERRAVPYLPFPLKFQQHVAYA